MATKPTRNVPAPVTPDQVVAGRVRALRLARQMTQLELAIACGGGYTEMVIHRLEKGRRRVALEDVYVLAFALGVSPLVLMLPANADTRMILRGGECWPVGSIYEWIAGMRPAPTFGEVNSTARTSAWLRLRKYLPFASRDPGGQPPTFDENGVLEMLRDNNKKGTN